jgi:hypothetical protein
MPFKQTSFSGEPQYACWSTALEAYAKAGEQYREEEGEPADAPQTPD